MNVKNMLNESLKHKVYYLILEQNRNIIRAGSKRQDKGYKMIYNMIFSGQWKWFTIILGDAVFFN